MTLISYWVLSSKGSSSGWKRNMQRKLLLLEMRNVLTYMYSPRLIISVNWRKTYHNELLSKDIFRQQLYLYKRRWRFWFIKSFTFKLHDEMVLNQIILLGAQNDSSDCFHVSSSVNKLNWISSYQIQSSFTGSPTLALIYICFLTIVSHEQMWVIRRLLMWKTTYLL